MVETSTMLTIQPSAGARDKCIPNILPCRIHHTGPTKITKRYWAPSRDKDTSATAHFRGRKLRGRQVRIPEGYQGLILKTTQRTLPRPMPHASIPSFDDENEDDDEEDIDPQSREDPPDPVKIAEQVGTFDELFVWGHDQLPPSDDPFVKNIEEWISFAEAIHSNNSSSSTREDKAKSAASTTK